MAAMQVGGILTLIAMAVGFFVLQRDAKARKKLIEAGTTAGV